MHKRHLFALTMAFGLISSASFAGTLTVTDIKGGVPGQFEFSIPSLVATDTNLTEAQIREIFKTGVVANASLIADLEATSITIPKWTWTAAGPLTMTTDKPLTGEGYGISLNEIRAGIIGSLNFGDHITRHPEGSVTTSRKLSITDLNVARVLRLFEVTGGAADKVPELIYRTISYDGFSAKNQSSSCEMGGLQAGALKLRPLYTPKDDMLLAAYAVAMKGAGVRTEHIAASLGFYADLLTFIETEPVSIGVMSCKFGSDEFSFGPIRIGAFSQNTLQESVIGGMHMSTGYSGTFDVGEVVIKPLDLTHVVAVLSDLPAVTDMSWLIANTHRLVPNYDGLSIENLSLKMLAAGDSLFEFDVAALDATHTYNPAGLPETSDMTIQKLRFPIPKTAETSSLHSLGITEFELDSKFSFALDMVSKTLEINRMQFSAKNLGTIDLRGTVLNYTEATGSFDQETALKAFLAARVQDLQVDIADVGLGMRLINQAAKEQGVTPEVLKENLAALIQSTLSVALSGNEGGAELSEAVVAFVNGNPDLSVIVTALDEDGLGLADFQAAEQNPFSLLSKVKIEASNGGPAGASTLESQEPQPTEILAPEGQDDRSKDKVNRPS